MLKLQAQASQLTEERGELLNMEEWLREQQLISSDEELKPRHRTLALLKADFHQFAEAEAAKR